MMGKIRSITMLCFLLVLLLSLGENQALVVKIAGSDEAQEVATVHEMFGAKQGSLKPQECGPRCTARCSATSYKKPCMFFCQKCCAKCLCVPPGTYGNKQFCPCYNNWKTKRGGPKCP